jgi:hypothetical protein
MEPELVALLFVVALLSGVFIVYMGLRQRGMQLEMEHRERMAMIEKGSIPIEPASVRRAAPGYARSSRSLSGGIIVVGLGLALMTIIGIAGESPEVGIGVGGAIAVLGGAFIVHSVVTRPAPRVEEHRSDGPF